MPVARSFDDQVEVARQLTVHGRHGEALRQLTALIKRFPLREQPVELLMRVHQRLGQRTEAMDAFHRLRARLVIDSGRAPSAALHALYDDIQHEEIPVLDQLPADAACFVGRTELLADLGAPAGITVITGQAGVGKTALAVHWANRYASAFPGGQVYLNLRGYDSGEQVRAADTLKHLLHALGVPPQRVPDSVPARAALFRTLIARRGVLVVLDNAARADQVQPLLTAPRGSAVVITSRDRLGALPDVDHVHLGLLEVDESHLLLERLLGADRVGAEPDAADALAWACGHLPLALRVVAGELAARPSRRLADAVTELVHDRGAVDRTTAALDLACGELPSDARMLLRHLGSTPGVDVTASAASALLGAPADQPLATLSAVHLVTQYQPGRYRMHDLVRHFAAARSAAEDGTADRDAALARWLDHLTTVVDAAGFTLSPTFMRLPRPRTADAFPDGRQASDWLAREHQNLMAAVAWAGENGFDTACVHLVDALRTCFWMTQDLGDWVRAAGFGLASAQRVGDPRLLAAMHCNSGMAAHATGRAAASAEHNARALALFEELDDWEGVAATLINMCLGYDRSSRLAMELQERAAAIGVEHSCVDTEVTASLSLTLSQLRLGMTHEAIGTATRCLRLVSAEDPRQRPSALEYIGWAHIELGELDRAQELLHEALELNSASGNRTSGIHCLTGLGHVSLRAGDTGRAVAFFRLVLAESEELGARRGVANALTGLAEALADTPEALEMAERALGTYSDIPDLGGQVATLVVLTGVHLAAGDPDAAGVCAEEAVALADEHEISRYAGRALRARAAVSLARQDHTTARAALSLALDRHRSADQRLHEVEDLMLLAEVLRCAGDERAADEQEEAASRMCAEVAGPHAPAVLRAAWLRTRGPRQRW